MNKKREITVKKRKRKKGKWKSKQGQFLPRDKTKISKGLFTQFQYINSPDKTNKKGENGLPSSDSVYSREFRGGTSSYRL